MGKIMRGKHTPLDVKRLEYCHKFLADYAEREAKYKKSLSINEKHLDAIQKALELEMQLRGIAISPLWAALGTIGFQMVSNVSGVVDSQPFNPPVG